MSSDPTPSPPPAEPVVEFFVRQRTAIAGALAVLGVVCLAVGGYGFSKIVATSPPAEQAADDPDKPPPDPEAEKAKVRAALNRTDYGLAGICGLMGAVACLGVAAYMALGLPKPTDAAQRTDARVAVLASGGLVGLSLMLSALFFFINWFSSLVAWVNDKKVSEAKWVLGPLLVFLVGGGLAFAAAQPARAEERNNPTLRRLVYGTNLGLTTLLLILLLIVANVFAALRVPNKLDTTADGLHSFSLSAPMREYLTNLTKSVQVYAIVAEDDAITTDLRRMLTAVHEAAPDKVTVRYLSPAYDGKDILKFRNKYPQIEIEQTGILIVLDENDRQAAYIRGSELLKSDGRPGGGRSFVFEGEAKVARELLFLTEGKSQPVVYVTAGAGELGIAQAAPDPAGEASAPRSAAEVRAALEKVNVQVRRLEAGPTGDVKVPDDADIVTVADPTTPLSDKTVAAIRTFMTAPRPNGKKGRLIVLAGAHRQPGGGAGVMASGIEPVLLDFGIQLRPQALYGDPVSTRLSAAQLIVGVNNQLVQQDHRLAVNFAQYAFVMRDCRAVGVAPGSAAQPLFSTVGDRVTWVEAAPLANPEQTWNDMVDNPNLFAPKNARRGASRAVAALASDADGRRVVVFGSGDFFADKNSRQAGPAPQAEVFVATVNWLRDRPAVADIAGKPYGMYTPKPLPATQVFWLPVLVALVGVMGVGFGVWVFRRK